MLFALMTTIFQDLLDRIPLKFSELGALFGILIAWGLFFITAHFLLGLSTMEEAAVAALLFGTIPGLLIGGFTVGFLQRNYQVKSSSLERHVIRVTSKGLSICNKKGEPLSAFRWDKVDEIQTYKHDNFVTDEICLAFVIGDRLFEVSEEDQGFKQIMEVLPDRFPGLSESWYLDVMEPAFASNHRVLWQR